MSKDTKNFKDIAWFTMNRNLNQRYESATEQFIRRTRTELTQIGCPSPLSGGPQLQWPSLPFASIWKQSLPLHEAALSCLIGWLPTSRRLRRSSQEQSARHPILKKEMVREVNIVAKAKTRSISPLEASNHVRNYELHGPSYRRSN